MDRRSTSAEYTHFGGDVTAQVNSSHGARLSGGSTGGILESVGDDTAVALRVRAQGAGILMLGVAANAVDIAGSSVGITSTHINLNSTRVSFSSGTQMQIGSTAPFAGFIRFTDTAVATPNFNTTNAMVIESSVTITGANSSHFVMGQIVSNGVASTDFTVGQFRTTSTANEVLFQFTKHSTVTVAASTCQMNFLVIRF
jgi:hypothetical protein